MNTDEVRKIAVEHGADLVGITSRERVEDLSAKSNPVNIMPGVKSIIVLGFQVLRGGLRGFESGSCWNAFGNANPFSVMVEETYNVCRELESRGWECVPLNTQSPDLRDQGVAVEPGKTEPDVIVDMYYLAYAAGLGGMGEGKFFLTPEYGPRQRFMAVLTDLELTPDPIHDGDVCDGCGECLKACPAKAFSCDEWTLEDHPVGTLKWRPLHVESCRICKTGVTSNPYDSGAEPDRLGAACGRACVAHLEASGRLRRSLTTPFRQSF